MKRTYDNTAHLFMFMPEKQIFKVHEAREVQGEIDKSSSLN